MASVSVRDVRKSFGSTAILHGVNVEISDGQFVVLVERKSGQAAAKIIHWNGRVELAPAPGR